MYDAFVHSGGIARRPWRRSDLEFIVTYRSMYRYNKRSKRRYNKQSGNIRTIRDDEDRQVRRGGRRSSHEVGRIVTKVVQRFLVQVCIDPRTTNVSVRNLGRMKVGPMADTHFPTVLVLPRAGLTTFFFFPLALSLASLCFSFDKAVSPLATFLTSTSLSGLASSLAWASTKVAYSGLS